MSTSGSYHHGDLRSTLLAHAMEMLENNEKFSLRALARRAGVSSAAPYRHFADRSAIESALAAEGFRSLLHELTGEGEAAALPNSPADLPRFAVAYVDFALRRPALFRLMYGGPCDGSDAERVLLAAKLRELLAGVLAKLFPCVEDIAALTTGVWALAHGLASLHLDGKLDASSPEIVAQRVEAAVTAMIPGQ